MTASASTAWANRARSATAFLQPPWPALSAIALVGWAVMAWARWAPQTLSFCVDPVGAAVSLHAPDPHLLLAMNPPGPLLGGWMVMTVAMMAPSLAHPVAHVRDRSFRRMRAVGLTGFAAGYLVVWGLAGLVLLPAALSILSLGLSAWTTGVFGVLVVVVWTFSPINRACLRACHRTARLSAFGLAAVLDCTRYGLTHGAACVGACWPLMFAPLLAGDLHIPAMLAAGAFGLGLRLQCLRRPPVRGVGLMRRSDAKRVSLSSPPCAPASRPS